MGIEINGSKKAFEMEFHWIFVLIAGAVIIGFFFMIAQKQKTISHEKLAVTMATQLDAAFASALESEGTTQRMPLPSEGITFYAPGTKKSPCGVPPSCDCNYYVFDRPTKFGDKIMFVPNELDASEAIVWTLDFKAPFRATNFFFMTTARTKYVIVASDDSAVKQLKNKMLKDLPELMEKQVIGAGQVKDITYNFANTRIIFLNEEPELPVISSASKGKQVSILSIGLNGNLKFYNKKPNSNQFEMTESNYVADLTSYDNAAVSDAVLYAAIFAESPHLYECQLKHTYQKLNSVAKIIRTRAEKIQTKISADKPHCAYQPAIDTMKDLEKISGDASADPKQAGAILSTAKQLQEQYKTLLILNCPKIY